MTLLELVQAFCLTRGLEKPSQVIASNKMEYRQIGGIVNEVCEYLSSLEGWQGVIREASLTTIAGSGQGDLKTLLNDQGFQSIVGDKIYNRTTNRELVGPVDSANWQYQKHVGTDVMEDQYRIQANRLYLHTDQPAGEAIRFEYYSKYLVLGAANVRKMAVTADNDTFLLDDRLMSTGLKAFWLRTKGMSYADEMRSFMDMVDRLAARDGGKPVLYMDGSNQLIPNRFKLTPYN